MCLFLRVELSDYDAKRIDEIASMVDASSGLAVFTERRIFEKLSRKIGISEHEYDCACDFLTDRADWSAPTWDMHPHLLQELAYTLNLLRSETRNGFMFEAIWFGDEIEREEEISIEEMIKIIEDNQIGTLTRYKIR